MKKLLLLLLACGMFASAFAQTEPLEPCCNIIAKDVQKNILIARDNKTGRLHQFRADALDMKAINLKDAVNIAGGKVTSISGAKRVYITARPDPIEPCCNIISIQPNPVEPCCSMVSIRNNTTNTNFTISVPKQISGTLSAGQAVSMDASTRLAIVQSSYGGNGQMNAYGYPATSGDNTNMGEGTSTEKWVITPVKTMRGVLGGLDINFPADVERNILFYQPADNKYITSVSRNDKTYAIAPAEYRITITNVPVENVPIQKGHQTRIKMGFLNLVSDGNWHLYDETKEKAYTSGNKPKKLALPIGNYQLKLGQQFYPFLIKEGETVEY